MFQVSARFTSLKYVLSILKITYLEQESKGQKNFTSANSGKYKIKDLPEDVKKAITDYVEATLLAADHDCLYLYEQGAKDCVTLLKKLGVL